MQTSNNKENDGTQRHTAVGRNDGGGISADGAGAIQEIGDFGDIRSFAEGLPDEHWGDREVSERELREIISEKLIEIAKKTGCFYSKEQYKFFSDQVSRRSAKALFTKKAVNTSR